MTGKSKKQQITLVYMDYIPKKKKKKKTFTLLFKLKNGNCEHSLTSSFHKQEKQTNAKKPKPKPNLS